MKDLFKNEKVRKVATAVKPWALFIGIFFLLKVTGIGNQLSVFTQSALVKAGVVDVDPETLVVRNADFDYSFTLKDLDGNKLNMEELKGKVLFINLWATWCGPCRAEMPSIQKLYERVDKDKVAFVMLSLDREGEERKIADFIEKKQFTFPVYQPASPLPAQLRVNTIPTTFIISPDGKIVTKKTGMANYDTEEMREFLRELGS